MKTRMLLLVFLLIILNSCSTKLDNLRKQENLLESKDDFSSILGLKYLRYADVLEKNHDMVSANYFAELAEDALYKNKYGKEFKKEFSKDNPDEQMADMYFLFNCWYYFETNNKNLGEATICKNSFLELYEQLEVASKIGVNDEEDKIIEDYENNDMAGLTKSEEIIYRSLLKSNKIDIFFDYDSFKLNNEANEKIKVFLKYISNFETSYKIHIIGHADRIGKTIYNNNIARKRTNTVFNILVKNGIPKDSINIKSYGSKSPKVITKIEDKNQLNRRVEIIVEPNFNKNDVVPQPIRYIKK